MKNGEEKPAWDPKGRFSTALRFQFRFKLDSSLGRGENSAPLPLQLLIFSPQQCKTIAVRQKKATGVIAHRVTFMAAPFRTTSSP